ncbi:MAG: DUF5680 domain-containing protein [Chloroflexota bacterium]
MKDLIDFLVEARTVTYAIPHGTAVGEGIEEMSYDRGEWRYRDRYAGQNRYGGQEMVWRYDQVVWLKNYIAEVVSNRRPTSEIYSFQREVLGQPDPEHLMRGPAYYTNGFYRYTNQIEGDLSFFIGMEQIYYDDEEVYRMTFHGGKISQ